MARRAQERWRPRLLGQEAVPSYCRATKTGVEIGKLSDSVMPLRLDIAVGETDGVAKSSTMRVGRAHWLGKQPLVRLAG